MASILLENQIIDAILSGKVTFSVLERLKFEPDLLSFHADLYDWMEDYYRKNNGLPSLDLVKEKSNSLFEVPEKKDDPLEIVLAIKENKQFEKFQQDLVKANNILKKTGSVEKAKAYMDMRLQYYDDIGSDDVFELTSEDFKAGEEDYHKRREAMLTQGTYGIPTGFGRELDSFLNGGWLAGNLYGIAGQTNVGKSWIAMVITSQAMIRGITPMYFALEGTLAKEYYRFLTVLTEQSNVAMQSGMMEETEFALYQKQMRELAVASNGKYYLALFGRRENYTSRVMLNRIRRYKPGLVVADYLTLFSSGDKQQEDWQTYLGVSKAHKNIANAEGIPVIDILQGTISNVAITDKMSTSDIAVSKGMARDFDAIFGVSKVVGKQNIIRVNSIKNRDSEGDFDAYFQTGWNTGKVKFVEFVDGQGSF